MKLFWGAFLSLFFVQISQAEVKTFKFSGTVDQLSNDYFFLNDSVKVGTEFEGYFDVATDVFEPTGSYTSYQYSEFDRSFMVKVGDYVFRSNPPGTDLRFGFENNGTNRFNQIEIRNLISFPHLFVESSSIWLTGFSGATWTNDKPSTISNSGIDIEGRWDGFAIFGSVRSVTEVTSNVPHVPTTENADAVEIRWDTQTGYFYQLQFSTNLTTWENIGERVPGVGTGITNVIPKQAGTVFYRSEVTRFDSRLSSPTNVLNRTFVGTVTRVENRENMLNDSIEVGTEFRGFYTYDQDNLDLPVTDPATGLTIHIGDYTFQTNPKHSDVYLHNQPDDADFTIWSVINVSSPRLMVEHLSFMPLEIEAIGLRHGFWILGTVDEIYETPELAQRPTISLSMATEVRWQSVMGGFYRMEASPDQVAWHDLGEEPMLGNGTTMSRFFRNPEGWFYRVVVVPMDAL